MRVSGNSSLAASFRDEVIHHLKSGRKLSQEFITPSRDVVSVISIHAWNRQVAALFFANGKFIVTYRMGPGSLWEVATVDDWTDTDADPYNFESMDPGPNVQVIEPKFFVFVTQDGRLTEAGRMGQHPATARRSGGGRSASTTRSPRPATSSYTLRYYLGRFADGSRLKETPRKRLMAAARELGVAGLTKKKINACVMAAVEQHGHDESATFVLPISVSQEQAQALGEKAGGQFTVVPK